MTDRSGQSPLRSRDDLEREIDSLRAENAPLREMIGTRADNVDTPPPPWTPELAAGGTTLFGDGDIAPLPKLDARSSARAKIGVFRALFCGRDDVYATRWDNSRTGKSGWSPAVVGGPANARKPDRAYLPLTDEVIEAHLSGRIHVGLYPLLLNDSCRMLACDFDGPTWPLDARAYQDAARALGFDAALERSRSGNGAHVWIFFAGPVAASAARRIGAHLVREAMTVRAELDLASYDRLFPAQDFLPKGSFGNLIALPLQGTCRKGGTTVFLDDSLAPHDDQFAFLSGLQGASVSGVNLVAQQLREVATGPVESTYRRPFRGDGPKPPDKILAVAGAMLAIDRIGLPPALVSALKHLASLHNPEYYEKERLRLSTWNTPRLIRCYEESIDQLLLPRGLREAAVSLAVEAGSHLEVRETAWASRTIEVQLGAVLDADQQVAFDELRRHELGVLVAPPGTGKTVVGCALIAQRTTSTLVLVDRQPLAEQWRERLQEHLGLKRRQIGTLGGGAGRLRGVVDVAMVQSLARREDIRELTSGYGFVIVDECHRAPRGAIFTGWDERPTSGRRDGRKKLGAARLPRWGEGREQPRQRRDGRRQRAVPASKADRCRETEPVVEAPRLVTSPEPGGYGLLWCSNLLGVWRPSRSFSGDLDDRGQLACCGANWRCHRGKAGHRSCQPVSGQRGKRSGGARRVRAIGLRAGAPSAVAAGAWRSRRSTRRPGKPATWGRAAANTQVRLMGGGRR